MKLSDLLKIVTFTMPKVNEFELIERYGLKKWLFIWIIKIGAFLFIMWFLFNVIGLKIGH